jgi:hypothetical protein
MAMFLYDGSVCNVHAVSKDSSTIPEGFPFKKSLLRLVGFSKHAHSCVPYILHELKAWYLSVKVDHSDGDALFIS